MADLIAIQRVTYAGRVYSPGVAFSARASHAIVLVARGFAARACEPQPDAAQSSAAPSPAQVPAAAPDVLCVDHGNDVEVLRATYEARTGRKPDKRWGVARLRKEMANP